MSIAWTEEQRKVIDLRDRNILVSAAAGSGKTAVLVERIIAMLTDAKHPVSVDSLLIVTFTEAAAAEMKDRIREAIEKKLEADDTNEHLKTQATLIHSAQITTIHSFCLSVIRDHFHAIDIDPGFRVGEEGELKLMKHDVLGQILEDRYQNGSREFLEFVEAYGGGRDDRKMEELVLKLYEYSRSYPDAEGWLASCVDAYDIKDEAELEGSRCMELIRKQSMLYMSDAAALIDEALDVCREPDGPSVYEEALLSDREIVNTFLAAGSYGQMYEAAADVRWTKLKANRDKTVSEEKAALVKAAREEVKKTVNDLCSQYLCQDAEGAVEDMTLCRRAMSVLASLVDEFACRFEERKRDQNMIDFSDMEQYALRILAAKEGSDFVPTAVAREYQQRFQEIMIDEYQDNNLIQETILTSVSTVSQGRNNVFMVGDVKQSIYRFRLSRPELFMEKFHTYDTGNSSRQRIDLHKNFRSRKEVLDSVNDIFEQIMTPALGGIMYDDEAALHIGAGFEESSEKGQNDTEVLLIDTDPALYVDDMDTEKKAIMPSDRELEARAIAARIRKLLENQTVLDKASGKSRKARYSDIVILTRSVKGFSDVFSEVLNKEGIPTYAGTKEGYFETQEIGVLLDYLRVLNNRKQDIPLAAVLKSPFLGLSDVEMADIKNRAVDLPFHEAVPAYASQEETPAGCRLKECLDKMEQFRKKVPYTPIHELLLLVLKETGYEEYVTAMPGGEQRKANLQMLIEKARAFESTSYKGLFHFIRYIEQLQKYDVDYGEASLEDEQSDTVRIMTIHKSKGLEFPIVFVSGMGKQFNMTDARSSVVLHARLGAGLDAVDTDMRTKSPSLLKRVIQKEEMQDSLGEELRVLYVALTRAKEKLIMTGTVKNAGRKLDSYALAARRKEQQLSFTRLVRAGSYLDWILPAVLRKSEDIPVNIERISAEDLVRESAGEYVKGRLTAEVLRRWDTGQVYDLQMKELIEEQFSYEYPYSLSQNQKLKFTVSELKKRAYMEEEAGAILYEEEDVVPLIPQFLKEEEELSGASRGTAYHRLLELLDFAEDYDGVLLKEAMERLRSEGKLTQDMADCIRPGDILRFLDSSAGRRMRNASVKQKLYKEQPFVLGVDAREMYPDEAEGELILVQGIIDVYFEEEDGLVVLDYKTDKAKSGVELREKYHAQLDYYARALEQVTGKHVKEKIIYSFTLQEEIEV